MKYSPTDLWRSPPYDFHPWYNVRRLFLFARKLSGDVIDSTEGAHRDEGFRRTAARKAGLRAATSGYSFALTRPWPPSSFAEGGEALSLCEPAQAE